MKVLAIAIVLGALAVLPARAQDVPPGVTYKRAPESANTTAKAALEAALAEPGKSPKAYGRSILVIGPVLWKSLEPSATKALKDAAPITVIIPLSEPVTAIGKRMLTDKEREDFWATLWKVHGDLKGATVRKARAAEISYYWATIPFDIEEPFFTIDTGKKQFVVDLPEEPDHGMVWVDLVGDLAALKERPK